MSDIVQRHENLPAFLQQDSELGRQPQGNFIIVPRLAVVQSTAARELKQQHSEGTLILKPDLVRVAALDAEVRVIPIMRWPTWEKWSDVKDDSLPPVIEATLDGNSELAKRCRDPKLRYEDYGPIKDGKHPFSYGYFETFNFVLYILDGDMAGRYGIYSARSGEHYSGKRLWNMIDNRPPMAIFANIFAIKPVHRERGANQWFGLDSNNPKDGKIHVEDEAFYNELKNIYNIIDEAKSNGTLRTTVEEDSSSAGGDGLPNI